MTETAVSVVTRTAENTVTETAVSVVTRTAENTVTETAVSTKNGIKWMLHWDPM